MTWRSKARLRPAELAELASCSLRTVRRRIESGEIASYRDGRCRFIPIQAALGFLGEPVEPQHTSIASEQARAFLAKMRRRA